MVCELMLPGYLENTSNLNVACFAGWSTHSVCRKVMGDRGSFDPIKDKNSPWFSFVIHLIEIIVMINSKKEMIEHFFLNKGCKWIFFLIR